MRVSMIYLLELKKFLLTRPELFFEKKILKAGAGASFKKAGGISFKKNGIT